MAKEYIERDAVIIRLLKVSMTDNLYGMGIQQGVDHAIDCLKEAPTADVVEVVRCKDCWKSDEGLCSYQLKNVPGKDFCGDGERRGNNAD